MKTIDVTPAWAGVLPLMLELYTQLASVGNRNLEQKNALAGLREEFEKMAKAADRYNESAKASDEKKAYLAEQSPKRL